MELFAIVKYFKLYHRKKKSGVELGYLRFRKKIQRKKNSSQNFAPQIFMKQTHQEPRKKNYLSQIHIFRSDSGGAMFNANDTAVSCSMQSLTPRCPPHCKVGLTHSKVGLWDSMLTGMSDSVLSWYCKVWLHGVLLTAEFLLISNNFSNQEHKLVLSMKKEFSNLNFTFQFL